MKTIICTRCSNEHNYEPLMHPYENREMFAPKYCDACIAILEDETRQAAEKNALRELIAQWESICPPLYRDTSYDDSRLSDKIRTALWEWEPKDGGGIALVGRSGVGKTRLAFLRLRELHMAGMRVFAVSAKRLERSFQLMFSDDKESKREATDVVNRAHYHEILFLDDVGKEKYTERVASDFYELIEYRTSNKLPTMWTANSPAAELVKRMGDEHGSATVRRLIEFSTVVSA